MATTTGSRAYQPGEDRSIAGRAKTVCQAITGRGSRAICNGPVRSEGPVTVHGHQAMLYQCERYAEHRFAIWDGKQGRRVADIPRGKAEWGQ